MERLHEESFTSLQHKRGAGSKDPVNGEGRPETQERPKRNRGGKRHKIEEGERRADAGATIQRECAVGFPKIGCDVKRPTCIIVVSCIRRIAAIRGVQQIPVEISWLDTCTFFCSIKTSLWRPITCRKSNSRSYVVQGRNMHCIPSRVMIIRETMSGYGNNNPSW